MSRLQFATVVFVLMIVLFSAALVSTPVLAHTVQRANTSYTMCGDYSFSRTLWHGIVPVAVKVNGHYCTNGSRIWEANWGPDCSNTTVYGSPSQTWCGAYNSGGNFMEPGENLTMNTAHGSWTCYLRGHFNQYGTLTKVWGGC